MFHGLGGVNIQYLREALKTRWLTYYRENREWIERLGIWVDSGGQRRPSANFILGTLAALEPDLIALLPLIVDLNHNPDRILMALGLNFNPDEAIQSLKAAEDETQAVKMLPGKAPSLEPITSHKPRKLPSLVDEACQGTRYTGDARERVAEEP